MRLFVLIMMSCAGMFANVVMEKLDHRMRERDTLLCVGLDPDSSKIPSEIMNLSLPVEEKIYLFLTQVVDLTAEHVCAYKIQKAFYDEFAGGHALLVKVAHYIKNRYGDIPVFVDCKIGDTENTMKAYIHNLFDVIQGDGVVINPYMGDDVFLPFHEDGKKVALVLVQTSNVGAKVVQELTLSSGELLWEKMLDFVIHRWNQHGNMIPILSSNTENYDYKKIRACIPQETPILLAGVGAQGGSLSVLQDLLNGQKRGVFINSSRGILYPYAVEAKDWREKIVAEAIALKERINRVRYENQ